MSRHSRASCAFAIELARPRVTTCNLVSRSPLEVAGYVWPLPMSGSAISLMHRRKCERSSIASGASRTPCSCATPETSPSSAFFPEGASDTLAERRSLPLLDDEGTLLHAANHFD